MAVTEGEGVPGREARMERAVRGTLEAWGERRVQGRPSVRADLCWEGLALQMRLFQVVW